MSSLVIIPARGGSKGIPHKNIKTLNGKPLIEYSIDIARQLVFDADICVSTDDEAIISVVENYGLAVPFKRPDALATDTCGTYEVLLHALDYYERQGRHYDNIILLQPTSPFRTAGHVRDALELYSDDIEMVVSVKEAVSNPYYNCFEEDEKGFLRISKGDGKFERRQDIPPAWEYNGSIYIINTEALKAKHISEFTKVCKFVMESQYSVDLDSMLDWKIAELMIKDKMV